MHVENGKESTLKKAQAIVTSLKKSPFSREGLVCCFLVWKSLLAYASTSSVSFSFHSGFLLADFEKKSRMIAVCDPYIPEVCPFIFSGVVLCYHASSFLGLLTAYSKLQLVYRDFYFSANKQF